MSTTPTIKTKLLDNGNTLVYGDYISMEAWPGDEEKITNIVTELETTKIKLENTKNNRIDVRDGYGFGPCDNPIKLYGVFILNKENETVHSKAGEFYKVKDAEKMMKDIKEYPGKYVNKEGEYIASIKLIVEFGKISGDIIPAIVGACNFDKRSQFVL